MTGETHYEPLDLSRSRSVESVEDSTTDQPGVGLPSPPVSDPSDDCKTPGAAAALVSASPGQSAAAAAVPSPRRSSRQRRRTAKAAGEDGCGTFDELVTPRKLHHHQHPRGSGSRPAYVCKLCDKEFTKHSSLVRHTYQHSG